MVAEYEYCPALDVTGISPGTLLERWTGPLKPPPEFIVTVDSAKHPLLAGSQELLDISSSDDPIGAGIGWGLTAPGSTAEFTVSGTTTPAPATLWLCILVFLNTAVKEQILSLI